MESPLSSLGTAAVVLIVVLVLVALLLLISLVRKHRKVHRPDTPVPTKVAYWVSLVYTVFPIDALPDPIYADDIVVLASGLVFVSRSLRRQARDHVER